MLEELLEPDYVFIRSLNPLCQGLEDEELYHLWKNKELTFKSPGEYIAWTYATKLIPAKFRPSDYRKINGDLQLFTTDWQLIQHFLEFGLKEGRTYERCFDCNFYRKMYLEPNTPDSTVEKHWAENPDNHASANELIASAGFTSSYWLTAFNVQDYLVMHCLVHECKTDVQAISHFISIGLYKLYPISNTTHFDPNYYRQTHVQANEYPTDVELYRFWLENKVLSNDPGSEEAFLRSLGLSISAIPAGFDFESYVELWSEELAPDTNRWLCFEHYVKRGIYGDNSSFFSDKVSKAILLLEVADIHARGGEYAAASDLYRQGHVLDPLNVKILQHSGDLELREGNHLEALAFYRQIRNKMKAGFWTIMNGATSALHACRFSEAVEWCHFGFRKYPRTHSFRTLRDTAVEQSLQAEINKHIERCRKGTEHFHEFAEAVRLLADVLVEGDKIFYGQEQKSESFRPRPVLNAPRVVMLANEDLPQCTHYRVRQKIYQAEAVDLDFRSFSRENSAEFTDACADADVAIFYRVAVDISTLRALSCCRRLRIPVFYEIDDLVFSSNHFPDSLESYAGTITPEQHFELQCGVALVASFISLCDFGIVSTEDLVAPISKLLKKNRAYVHRNGLSPQLEAYAKSLSRNFAFRERSEVVLFYASGTKAHSADFSSVLEPAVEFLMNKYKNLVFNTCGYVPVSRLLQHFPDRVSTNELVADYGAFISLLNDCDINLSILHSSVFNDCKSEIKWLEAAAVGVPTVASAVNGFKTSLIDGLDVLLVEPSVEDWIVKLESLIVSPKQRAAVAREAVETALSNYSISHLGWNLRDIAAQSLVQERSEGKQALRTRSRILLVNVFAKPQSIGGATRIFDEHVRILAAEFADEYEVFVCCGNSDPGVAYSIEAYEIDGLVKAYSINTPAREFMDWIHHDEGVRKPFERIIDLVSPDLIHFHCIQRLTNTVAEVAIARKIPYYITLHDAWWISDHQFLMDERNMLVDPAARRSPWEVNVHPHKTSTKRRSELALTLRNAEWLLPVSGAFADIYRNCGHLNLKTIENGLGNLPPPLQEQRYSDKVVLGHVGGATYHKGFFLLKKAILAVQPSNIEVLVIDHAMQEGETRYEEWGNVAVTCLGKWPQKNVNGLYARFDVLVATSMWPESFGLVTREANYYRKHVIASNLGAIADPVVPDKNGFVVDVTNSDQLACVLLEIDNDPEKYKAPTDISGPSRSSFSQVMDYVLLYKEKLQSKRGSVTLKDLATAHGRTQDQVEATTAF